MMLKILICESDVQNLLQVINFVLMLEKIHLVVSCFNLKFNYRHFLPNTYDYSEQNYDD